jgi:hypothetical protein
VDLRAGLDDVEERKFFILPGLELRPLGRSARSQSLYRLRYPGSLWKGFGLDIGFIDHLYTRLGTTCNYSAAANLHNS